MQERNSYLLRGDSWAILRTLKSNLCHEAPTDVFRHVGKGVSSGATDDRQAANGDDVTGGLGNDFRENPSADVGQFLGAPGM